MIRLINTIEISPLKYLRKEYDLPEISDYPDPEEWYRKWEEAASRLSIDFHAVQTDSYLVDIEKIDDENLEIILKKTLADIESDDFEDHILAFDGGVVLKEDHEVLIHPNCCGTIADIKQWQNIFEHSSPEWTGIWIGHPWILFKKENGEVLFSDYTDLNIEEITMVKTRFKVDEAELKAEFQKIIQQQIHFKNRIAGILKRMNIKDAEAFAELMTGIKYSE